MIFEYFKVVLMILYLIMFGRFLASVGRISAPNFKPVFNNFPKQPLSVQKMQCASLLGRLAVVPNNFQIQNLLEFLQKCENDLETKCEINSLNQISLLCQDTQAGLTKTPVSPKP